MQARMVLCYSYDSTLSMRSRVYMVDDGNRQTRPLKVKDNAPLLVKNIERQRQRIASETSRECVRCTERVRQSQHILQ